MICVPGPVRARTFEYLGVDVDAGAGTITCRFRSGDDSFSEVAAFDPEVVDLGAPGVEQAAVLYCLLAGLSYYKAAAAHEVILGELGVGPASRALLAAAIDRGLAEFAYRNDLDLSDVSIRGGAPVARATVDAPASGPLVPFGGGIDSIVTVLTAVDADAALFIVGPSEQPFDAIERPARLTGLPVVRATRTLDPSVLGPRRTSRFDGHVPVTAMISALAVVAALGQHRGAVVMSNERSASVPNLLVDGRGVNHQWSKSLEAEDLLRAALDECLEGGPAYYSALRDRSELWVASRLAESPAYLEACMSCNRAFRQDPAARATTWCGECDKCLFVDLVLAPFVDRAVLEAMFAGKEPIGDPASCSRLEVLTGLVDNPKPFECVGDVDECATALVAAASREDRADQPHLAALGARLGSARPLAALLERHGRSNAPVRDAARDLV